MNRYILLTSSISLASLLLLAAPITQAYEKGDLLVRGRIINVNPDESSSVVSVGTPLAPVAGSDVGVSNDITVELDFTYMLHRNWGVELILGSSRHDVPAKGSLAALGDVVDARTLPPTLTMQYHFRPDGDFRPYAGIGVNYTHFFDEKVTGGLDAPGAKVRMDSSWGLAAQIGADFKINKEWFINADLKYIDMSTTAHFKNTTVGAVEVDVDVDPWVFGIGIGRRF
ncbi:MAG: OmpW family protein [Gammaproteobacteria bacterium]|nr:OmpW family protein [Gammaproteobacteria bacterium]